MIVVRPGGKIIEKLIAMKNASHLLWSDYLWLTRIWLHVVTRAQRENFETQFRILSNCLKICHIYILWKRSPVLSAFSPVLINYVDVTDDEVEVVPPSARRSKGRPSTRKFWRIHKTDVSGKKIKSRRHPTTSAKCWDGAIWWRSKSSKSDRKHGSPARFLEKWRSALRLLATKWGCFPDFG